MPYAVNQSRWAAISPSLMPCHFGIASRNPLWAPRIQTYLRILPHRLEAAGRDMQPPCDNQINKPVEQQCAGDQRAKAGVDEGRCCKRDDAEKPTDLGRRYRVAVQLGHIGGLTSPSAAGDAGISSAATERPHQMHCWGNWWR